jgi:hypothetical protein
MDDRVPSPPPHSDTLRPLFTHAPLPRRDGSKEDTRHSQNMSPNALETPAGSTPHESQGSHPHTSVSTPALVQPGVEGSTTQNRPSNSWLRYRRLKQIELAHLGLKMGELSRVIAKMWKEEPQDIKDFHKAQCQEQWASDRANGYQYRQPKMPLPGEPRAKKGRSGPWRKTQRPLVNAGSVPAEAGDQLVPFWVPPHVPVGDDEATGPEIHSHSGTRATPKPRGGGPRGSRGSRGSPYTEVALHRDRTLGSSSTPYLDPRVNTLSLSTSSSSYRPDDALSPRLLAADEPTEFEFSPPHSEYDMDVDPGVPLAPLATSAAQSPLSDPGSSPAPAAPRGITLPSLRQDPILSRALELPPVYDHFTVCCFIVDENLADLPSLPSLPSPSILLRITLSPITTGRLIPGPGHRLPLVALPSQVATHPFSLACAPLSSPLQHPPLLIHLHPGMMNAPSFNISSRNKRPCPHNLSLVLLLVRVRLTRIPDLQRFRRRAGTNES